MIILPALLEVCAGMPQHRAWLEQLPQLLASVTRRWSIFVQSDHPFDASAAWVAPACTAGGAEAVLKLTLPHMEAEDEIKGLRFWAGEPTVALLEADPDSGAMLLERCVPAESLRNTAEEDQDPVIADLLRRLWRVPQDPGAFRPLSYMVRQWCAETELEPSRWPDPTLTGRGLRMLEELATSAEDSSLLATDLHAGNVLSSGRQPWVVIDPKPFVGDRAFDATQHLLNCRGRLRVDPARTIGRFARLLDVDPSRVARWLFARLAAEPRAFWRSSDLELARLVASVA